MAGQHSKRNRRSRNAKAAPSPGRRRAGHRCRGNVGLRDGHRWPLRPRPTPTTSASSTTSLTPSSTRCSSVDPTLAADATGWLASLDSALAGASSVDPSSAAASTTDFAHALGHLHLRTHRGRRAGLDHQLRPARHSTIHLTPSARRLWRHRHPHWQRHGRNVGGGPHRRRGRVVVRRRRDRLEQRRGR